MPYQLVADAIVVLHAAFIVFVVAGGALLVRWPQVAWLHAPAACWGAVVELAGWPCPLTPLENHLRDMGGQGAYSGDFIVHYLMPVIYPAGLTASVQTLLGIAVIAVNLIFYGVWWHGRRQRKTCAR